MNRIPTLDGWRGIAIALVLFDHIQDSILHHYLAPWMRTGIHGVTIFFVLSGYLITSKLLEGPIDLSRFYMRRFLRLMPAAWLVLGAMALVQATLHLQFTSTQEVIACVFFFRNFLTVSTGSTGHFWSLSIEEQFYFVWPCILVFGGRMRAPWIALAGILTCAAYRYFHWSIYETGLGYSSTQMHADALLIGCLLALFLHEKRHVVLARKWSKMLALPAFAVLCWCLYRFQAIIPLCESVSIAILITATQFHPRFLLARPLSFLPLAWLGTVSYSVYLWQEPLMGFRSAWVIALGLPICALSSYYFVEQPFVRLGHRLTRRQAGEATGAPAELPLTSATR